MMNRDPRRKTNKLTKDEIQKILMKARAGWQYKEVAPEYGVTTEKIGYIARRSGIYRRPGNTKTVREKINSAMPHIVKDIKDQTRSFEEIAEDWGISLLKLSKIAKARGLSRPFGLRSSD